MSADGSQGKIKPGYYDGNVRNELDNDTTFAPGSSGGGGSGGGAAGGDDDNDIEISPIPNITTPTTPVIRKRLIRIINGKITDQRVVYIQKYNDESVIDTEHAGADYYRFVYQSDTAGPSGTSTEWLPYTAAFESELEPAEQFPESPLRN